LGSSLPSFFLSLALASFLFFFFSKLRQKKKLAQRACPAPKGLLSVHSLGHSHYLFFSVSYLKFNLSP
jgi:hypothetical protein